MVFLTNNQIQDWICHVSVSSASIMPSQLIAEFFRRLMVVHAQNLRGHMHQPSARRVANWMFLECWRGNGSGARKVLLHDGSAFVSELFFVTSLSRIVKTSSPH